MNLPLFAKLLVSACTVGGGSFGAYAAGLLGKSEIGSNSELINNPKLEENSSRHFNYAGKDRKEIDRDNSSDDIDSGDNTSSSLEGKGSSSDAQPVTDVKSANQQINNFQREESSDTPSTTETKTFSFQSTALQSELDNATSDISEKEDLEEDKEASQEIGEKFEDFVEDYDDSNEYEEGEIDLKIAEYIKTGNENQELSDQGPTCETWMRKTGNQHSISKENGENCTSRIQGKEWGRGDSVLLLTWLEVDQVKAKKVLKHYGLWSDNTQFKNDRKNSWDAGNWSCSRQFFGEDKFTITCDYYSRTN
ncbi:hypothetical protein [Mycoplasma suis]|uniref:Uncharacterized protein n=1 Tax=Mycoplasma suis (strain Illinois) TaxID=768700 RepID=F0QQM1_MYCSL|nr:hypothetical protein [Mycoplasma suis]ADX97791.1 hypothetical protein MSU_0247 [Mycoplasma suis str. Illinois]